MRTARGDATILVGHVIDQLRTLEADSVNCVVTSPPYWSLRKYDAPDVVWGGEDGCEHEWGEVGRGGAAVEGYAGKKKWQHSEAEAAARIVGHRSTLEGGPAHQLESAKVKANGRLRSDHPEDWTRIVRTSALCSRCGAWRGQYGLEPTPELYVEHTLLVLREIRRVLRKDGVVWWNTC